MIVETEIEALQLIVNEGYLRAAEAGRLVVHYSHLPTDIDAEAGHGRYAPPEVTAQLARDVQVGRSNLGLPPYQPAVRVETTVEAQASQPTPIERKVNDCRQAQSRLLIGRASLQAV